MPISPLEKPDNLQADKIEALKDLFPQAFSDGKLNLDALKEELGDLVDELPEGEEHYGLNWPGKRDAKRLATMPPTGTLKPVLGEGVNEDTTKNLIIEGDNLEVLRIMQKAYAGRIKMIYIDPPYNTGNDFVYKDDFREPVDSYLRKSGQADEEGLLVANPKASGRFHSAWLNMMYPRLKLARTLLQNDGVVFISIDDNESTNLKSMCDEVFGEENFVSQFIWSGGRKNDSKLVSNSHEYVLAYLRSADYYKEKAITWRQTKKGLDAIYAYHEELKKIYKDDYAAMTLKLKEWYRDLPNSHPAKQHKHYSTIDRRGIYFPDNISWPGGGGPKYEVLHPITKKPVKIPSRGWIYSDPKKMQDHIADDRVHFGPDEKAVPCAKAYLVDRETQVPYSVFYQDGRAATKRLRALMDGNYFDHPKDETILEEFIKFIGDRNCTVLDFFAGSGTTAHAVFNANYADSGNRRFILVQLPEKHGIGPYSTISDLTIERVRRLSKGLKDSGASFDVGFKVSRLAKSNFRKWTDFEGNDPQTLGQLFESLETPFVDGWTPKEVLAEVMLTEGFPLDSEVSQADEFEGRVQRVKHPELDLILLLCLDEALEDAIVEKLVGLEHTVFVCRESALTDQLKLQLSEVITVKTL